MLITGESGTGKEVVARAIHNYSAAKAFFSQSTAQHWPRVSWKASCSAMKGSATGASARKEGRFELAADGTLFLDELGEMPSSAAGRCYACCRKDVRARRRHPDAAFRARIIAATNRDLNAMIANGDFAKICTTDSTSYTSICPRCVSAYRTYPPLPSIC